MGGSHRDNTPGFAPGTDEEGPLGSLARTTADDLDLADEAMRARLSQRMFGANNLPPTIARFSIRRRVGTGGMGSVYEAHDPDLDRLVALKLLHGDLREEHQIRLKREAQALARIRHENVVRVFEVGSHEGRLFLAMELVDGLALRQWQREQSPSWRELIEVYTKAGDGLAAAHAAGLVHRDFKPANVMVRRDGSVQVLDFGLARDVDGTADVAPPEDARGLAPSPLATRVTVTGTALGTPLYMSPEQMLGQPVDAASDQFSFCVALYEALYGEHPFGGESSNELCHRMLSYQLRPAPRGPAPRRIARILARGLRPRNDERYPNMHALVAALRRPFARRWAPVGVAAIAVVAAGGAAAAGNLSAAPCEAREGLAASVWDVDAKSRIEARLRGHGFGVSYPGVDKTLEDWSNTWTTHYAEACVAAPESAGRIACLEQQLQSVESMVTFLDTDDATIAARASFVVSEVPSAIQCLDSDGQATDRDAEAALYLARLSLSGADYPLATTRAQQQLEEATASGDARLEGEATLVLGQIAAAEHHTDRLTTYLERAAHIGLEIGAPQLTVDAWSELALAIKETRDDAVTARRLHAQAVSLLPQLSSPDSRAALLKYLDGTILVAEQRAKKASEVLAEARRDLERTTPPGSPVFVELDTLLAAARCTLGNDDAAVQQFGALHDQVLERGVIDHARLATIEYHWSGCLSNAGRHEEAETQAKAALAHLESSSAVDPGKLVDVLTFLSEASDDLGKYQQAMETADRATTLAAREIPGTQHQHRALLVRATALQNFDRFSEALETVETALALRASLGLEMATSNHEIGHVVLAFYAEENEKCARLVKRYAASFKRRPAAVKQILEAFAAIPEQYGVFLEVTGLDPLAFGAPPPPTPPQQ